MKAFVASVTGTIGAVALSGITGHWAFVLLSGVGGVAVGWTGMAVLQDKENR